MSTTTSTLRLEESTVGGPRYLLGVFPALMGRNAEMWAHFRVSMVMELLNMAAQASLFFFLGRALGAGGQDWAGNYAAFLAIGLVFNTFLEASLNGPYQSLAQNYWSARLESMLASPCPVWAVVITDSVWAFVRATINAVILGMIGWAFGARLHASASEVLCSVTALLLAVIAVLGFGLMAASTFMLINAKGFNNPVSWLIGILQGLVTGAYFPVQELPSVLQGIAKCLPQTYAIDIARRLLLDTTPTTSLLTIGFLSPVASSFVMLSGFVLLVPALGAWMFHLGMRKAQSDGGLSRWA
jgi:ABC-type polysaccharide/polyol phosphate export permease